jgi:predicted nucleic acid-binding protein
MKHLIDTNVWIDALSGGLSKKVFLELVLRPQWVGYSAITRLELFGFPGLNMEQEQKLLELLEPFVEVGTESKIIDRAITIRKAMRIKAPDAIIAATALENDSSLVTHNTEDFKNIAGLRVVDPYHFEFEL